SSIWIGGFSFGAWIGMQLLMRRPEIHGYVSISPPANVYDFNFLAPCPNEGLIIQGDNDQIASIESVNRLVDKLKDQRGPNGVDYRVISGAGHFFNNEGETELMLKHVNEYLNCVMLARKAAA
ncbi:MAG: alpha/beta hydrolase, partial [Alphaproteobacteria bacterium]|nr:alpha/beta hydrolase [Alphaproteobacteria bacterium]